MLTTNTTGAAEGVRHLVAAGHRRIAFLGDQPHHHHRAAAATTATGTRWPAAGARRSTRRWSCTTCTTRRSPTARVTALLRRPDPPTALFTAQNLVTIGAVRALRRLRLRARRSRWSASTTSRWPTCSTPAITVVAQDPATIGRIAAERLFDRIDGDQDPPEAHLVPTTLIRRGSGEIRPPDRTG